MDVNNPPSEVEYDVDNFNWVSDNLFEWDDKFGVD